MPTEREPAMLPLLAELQDHLLVARHDLGRLATLLDDACAVLVAHAGRLASGLEGLRIDESDARVRLLDDVGALTTALQFHDLSTQLLAHTGSLLAHCVDRMGAEALAGDEEDEQAVVVAPLPGRPNPVTQAQVDAGSVELF